jgi:hypothetical protein
MPALATPTVLDRIWKNFRELVRGELAELTFLGTYEYSVQTVNGDNSIDGVCTDPKATVPPISHAPIDPGLLAESATAVTGMLCRVNFLNGSPTRPVVTGFKGGVVNGQLAGGGPPAARVGDAVVVTFPSLLQFSGVTSTGPVTGLITVLQPAVGIIQAGSTKLGIGG